MQAIFVDERGLRLIDMPKPDTKQGEVLVGTNRAGICATDLELYKGMYGFRGVPGHEFVGRVEHDPGGDLTGERVVADINCGCKVCSFCIQNNARHCPDRSVIGIRSRNGAFAEYVSVPGENLHIVPQEISDDQAVFAEPLAAAMRIAEQIHLTSQTRVAVLGDGKLGLLIAFSLGLYSENINLLGHHRENLDIAAKQGINTFNTSEESSWRDVVQGHNNYDLVVEATGSPSGLEEAIDLTRPQGTIVLKTTCSKNPSVDISRIAVKELKIQGSRCGNISWALYNLQKGRINVEPLIEAVYPFHDFQQAMQHAAVKGTKKILLDLSCM